MIWNFRLPFYDNFETIYNLFSNYLWFAHHKLLDLWSASLIYFPVCGQGTKKKMYPRSRLHAHVSFNIVYDGQFVNHFVL